MSLFTGTGSGSVGLFINECQQLGIDKQIFILSTLSESEEEEDNKSQYEHEDLNNCKEKDEVNILSVNFGPTRKRQLQGRTRQLRSSFFTS